MLTLKLMTLSGKFTVARTVEVADLPSAMALVLEHAHSNGFTNVKPIEDVDSIRYTAKTPGGRGGINVAYLDFPE